VEFKPFSLKLRFDDPEEAEVFLQGCIVAMTNNNSPKWRKLIDGVNSQMLEYRAARLKQSVEERDG